VPDRELFEIAASAIEASTRPEKWTDVCERLGARCDALFALVFEFDPTTHGSPIFHTPGNLDVIEEFIALFTAGASNDEPRAYESVARQEVGAFLPEAELLGVRNDADIPHNAFRDSYFPLIGARSRGAARLNDIGPYLDVLSMHFGGGSDEMIPSVRSDVALVGPVIGKAIEAGRIFRALSREYGMLLEAFDYLDCGAIICEPDGHVLLSNRAFCALAHDADVVTEVGGALSAAVESKRTVLARLVRDAARAEVSSRDLVIALERRSGQLPVIAKGAPLRSADIRADETLSLLLFVDPEDETRLSVEGLAAFGVLSPAEIEVCELLVRGFSTVEIANRRDTSAETTRAQIKSASAKLLCSSRLDLVRLALTTRAPIAARSPSS